MFDRFTDVFTVINKKNSAAAQKENNDLREKEIQLIRIGLMAKVAKIALWDTEIEKGKELDRDSAFYWSDDFRNMLGFSDKNDLPDLFSSWIDRVHPEDRPMMFEKYTKHLADKTGKTPYDCELRVLTKSGVYRHIRTFGTAQRNNRGEPTRMAGAIMDITEQMQMIEKIRKKDKLLIAVNQATDAVFKAKAGNIFKNSLKKGMGIIGDCVKADSVEIWKNEIINGECYAVLKHQWLSDMGEKIRLPNSENPDNSFAYSETPDWYSKLSQGGFIEGAINTLSEEDRKFASRFSIQSLFVIPLFVENKFWGIFCIDDYTDERSFDNDETDILRSVALMFVNAINLNCKINEMALQTATLKTIIDSLPDLIFTMDSDMNYTLFNKATRNYFGFPENFYGKINLREHRFTEEAVKRIEVVDKKIIETGEKYIYEDQLISKDGETRFFETVKAPLIQNDGTVAGLVGICRDITEKNQMIEAAKAGSKAKGNFLSTMSHEMRTPMNAISGMATIGKKADSIEEKNRAFNRIQDASAHLLNIINDVLDMAKIEANKLELSIIEYNFERMLQKLMSLVRFKADEKRQNIEVNIAKEIPRFIVGDDQRLSQAIMNLLSNAIKFTPEGGRITLNVSLDKIFDDGSCELRFEVSDDGIGISPEKRKMLFQAFEQGDSNTSREYGGTGLGLVITKRIIELMNGEIWVESKLGEGSKFTFTAKVRQCEKNFHSLLAPDVNLDSIKILAVDDMPDTREYFQDIFNQLGINCDVAADGVEALDIIKERGGYDLYFVDWRMPNMNGIELTRKIKAEKHGKNSVVIMITALDWEQIRDDALSAGVDKHLLKPLFSSSIIDCLNECMGIPIDSGGGDKISDCEFEGKRMLLVDDVEVNREILILLLQGTQLEIDCAENGLEALEMIEASPKKYDIVFMDIQMPVMDGYKATRKIRKNPACVNLPIIAMTANVFQDEIEACLEAGMNEHLSKPVDIDNVLVILRKYLSKRKTAKIPAV